MLQDILEVAPTTEVLEIVRRLQDFLPEYSRTKVDDQFSLEWRKVEELKNLLAIHQAKMREEALRVLEKVKKNWSAEEIEKACGYEL